MIQQKNEDKFDGVVLTDKTVRVVSWRDKNLLYDGLSI